jgi:tetratricopeptide (TPR) repeat protein
MKFRQLFTATFVVGVGLITAGVCGFFSPFSKTLSFVSTLIGTFISLYSLYNSSEKDRSDGYFKQAIVKQFFDAGMGNTYSGAMKEELYSKGTIKNTLHMKDKALSINPNDQDAMAILSCIYTLKLCFQYQQGMSRSSAFKKRFPFVKQLVNRGLTIYPDDYYFHDANGMLLDIKEKHEEARKEFAISGSLRKDPYWHIHMATSWQMSGDYEKAFEEIEKAVGKGAKNVDFYYGRILQAMGKYEDAQKHLKYAIKNCKGDEVRSIRIGWKAGLYRELSYNELYQGNFAKSSIYTFKYSLYLLCHGRLLGLVCFITLPTGFLISLTCKLSKLLIPLYRNFSVLKKIIWAIAPPDRPEIVIYRMLYEKGHYTAAKKILCEIIQIYRKLGDKIKVAQSLVDLGGLCLVDENFEEAETEFQKAIEIFRSIGQKKEMVVGYDGLCNVYRATNNDNMLKQSDEIKKQLLAEIGLSEAEVFKEIGVISKEFNIKEVSKRKRIENQATKGEKEYVVGKNIDDDLIKLSLGELEKYFEAFENDFADMPGFVSAACNNAAMKLMKINEYDKAEMLYKKALKRCKGSTPKEKMNLAGILNNLAGIYVEKKQYGKAKETMGKAMKILENIETNEAKTLYSRFDNNLNILNRKIVRES